MLRLLAGILIILWLVGLLVRIAGGFVYSLLIVGLILLVIDMLRGHQQT